MLRAVCLLVGYALGNFLTAEIVARLLCGKNAAQIGNGNPGMANIIANVGLVPGLIVLAGDALKTVAACTVCYMAAGARIGLAAMLYGGLGAVLGHNHPAWRRWRGGKGVAVTCVWLIMTLPVTGALCCAAGGAVVLCTGYLPLGAVVIPVLAMPFAWWQLGAEGGVIVLLSALMMLARHRNGLHRIRRGTEVRVLRRKPH